jgi:hypothetical protein
MPSHRCNSGDDQAFHRARCSRLWACTVGARSRKGPDMTGAPDQYVDEAKIRAADLQRARQRQERAKTRKLARVRLILRRLLGHENPPGSP